MSRLRHGHAIGGILSLTYKSWRSMIARCTNPNSNRYAWYKGRGITICDSWMVFDNFLADMGERPSVSHTIERKDNNGNYEKSNCRWATKKEQSRNTRRNRLFTFDGKTLCLAEWAELKGIRVLSLTSRLEDGWTFEEAITTPIRPMKNGRAKQV